MFLLTLLTLESLYSYNHCVSTEITVVRKSKLHMELPRLSCVAALNVCSYRLADQMAPRASSGFLICI